MKNQCSPPDRLSQSSKPSQPSSRRTMNNEKIMMTSWRGSSLSELWRSPMILLGEVVPSLPIMPPSSSKRPSRGSAWCRGWKKVFFSSPNNKSTMKKKWMGISSKSRTPADLLYHPASPRTFGYVSVIFTHIFDPPCPYHAAWIILFFLL